MQPSGSDLRSLLTEEEPCLPAPAGEASARARRLPPSPRPVLRAEHVSAEWLGRRAHARMDGRTPLRAEPVPPPGPGPARPLCQHGAQSFPAGRPVGAHGGRGDWAFGPAGALGKTRHGAEEGEGRARVRGSPAKTKQAWRPTGSEHRPGRFIARRWRDRFRASAGPVCEQPRTTSLFKMLFRRDLCARGQLGRGWRKGRRRGGRGGRGGRAGAAGSADCPRPASEGVAGAAPARPADDDVEPLPRRAAGPWASRGPGQ